MHCSKLLSGAKKFQVHNRIISFSSSLSGPQRINTNPRKTLFMVQPSLELAVVRMHSISKQELHNTHKMTISNGLGFTNTKAYSTFHSITVNN